MGKTGSLRAVAAVLYAQSALVLAALALDAVPAPHIAGLYDYAARLPLGLGTLALGWRVAHNQSALWLSFAVGIVWTLAQILLAGALGLYWAPIGWLYWFTLGSVLLPYLLPLAPLILLSSWYAMAWGREGRPNV